MAGTDSSPIASADSSRSQNSIRVPAEWEPQAAVWLAWPSNRETWPGRFESIPAFFADWARLIAESTPVRILAAGNLADSARRLIGSCENVDFFDVPTDDCWVRDYGPTFVIESANGKVSAVDWRYNAWGGKYPPWDKDAAAAGLICSLASIDHRASRFCLEGGAIESDGLGRCLTTSACLLTDTRNPGWSVEQICQLLHRCLGATEIAWIDGGGLVGDDTDGHIDQLAQFVDHHHVVVAVCDDPEDPNHAPLEENYRQLRLWGASTLPRVEVHRLPIPPAAFIDGQRLPQSYCNFLMLGKDRILVPTFSNPRSDDHALGLLRELGQTAEVVGIDCCDLSWGLGTLHCASRDQPRPESTDAADFERHCH